MSGTVPFWRPALGPSEWDGSRIGGVYVPGKSSVSITPSRGVEIIQGKDEDGNTLKDLGYKGAKVDIVVTIWDELHLPEFVSCLALWSPRRPGAVAAPIELACPQATLANVTRIYIESYTIGDPNPDGSWSVPISAYEWFPPEAVKPTQQGGTPKGGLPGGDGGPLGDPGVPPADPENLGPNL